MCPAGQFSDTIDSLICNACAPGKFAPAGGSTACTACAAGKHAYFSGLSTCPACPAGTGSVAGASTCVSCSQDSTCRNAAQKACVPCPAACTACVAGKYNDATSLKCVGCAAGTYSTAVQAISSETCSRCEPGFTTRPTDTGVTSCTSCAALNQTVPLNALVDASAVVDPLVCGWSCEQGYTLVNVSETGFRNASHIAIGYTPSQSVDLFHAQNDYCCNPTLTSLSPGLYLKGCNRTYDGDAAECPPIANGYYFFTGVKVDHCSDWACNDGFFSNGTVCVKQRVCEAGYTYRRDALGEIMRAAFGAFECVPCSACVDGSTLRLPCNGSVDTQCVMCASTSFSVRGGPCLSAPPLGSIGVVIRLTALPPFQGRPSVYWDGTPIKWSSINFATGFFMNSYTACRPTEPYLAYRGGDLPCYRLDTAPTACVQPKCNSQCLPWNGTAGWYLVPSTGLCAPCVYESSCAANQYSDMQVCGPTSTPQCAPCPATLPPNALSWINPGRILYGYPPCDVVCRSGYVRTDNFTCISCPNLPDNSKVTVGCDWVCSLGYVPVGNLCVPCTGEPASCGVGMYVGYVEGEQCAKCLPCTNAVVNSAFVSPGSNNGPNTCGIRCNQGTFVDPVYGLDVYNNPVVCAECSAPHCVPGESFLTGCTADEDAYCAPCSECPAGSRERTPCTVGADTTCTPCDPALLPLNAVWTAAGCEAWECADAYYLSTDGTLCIPCKQPRDCTKSDRFDYRSAGCGVCTPCDPALLKPWQCFNGDGQCGATYWCGFTTLPPPIASTAVVTTVQTTTTATPPPTTAAAVSPSYATLMTVTLAQNVTLADLLKSISCPDGPCTVKIVSVTQNRSTTYCSETGCGRRLLQDGDLMTVEIVVLSPQPQSPVINSTIVTPISITTTGSYLVTDENVLRNATLLRTFIKKERSKDEAPVPYVLIVSVCAACFIVVCLVAACIANAIPKSETPTHSTVTTGEQFDWKSVRLKDV